MATQTGQSVERAAPPVSGVLQRRCACGQHTAGSECTECGKNRLSLQRATRNSELETTNSGGVPSIVHEVLRSPGQPLDKNTRTFMEPRFGHDFSGVRLHTDAKAADSAQAVNALAYTVGRDVVFGKGQSAPGTPGGKALLAHELAHVIQQNHARPAFQSLAVSSPADADEREAHSAAHAVVSGGPVPAFSPAPLAIHRQPPPGQVQPGGTQTITNSNALIRGGPGDFKSTGQNLAVGTRADLVDTQTSAKGTFVNLVEHGTRKALGWTSKANLGDVQYATAAASFVYVAKVKPRQGFSNTLPVMVYLPPKFDAKKSADVVLFFHGDAADYSASEANNYDRENPAIGMNLAGLAAGATRIIIAPQVNEWAGTRGMKSPWDLLQAGDYESIVQTVFTNLQADLNLNAAISRGAFSIAGHSGGGKALGRAVQDLDPSGGGVTDVTLVEAGYGGGEDKAGKSDEAFAKSFQMVRDWLLKGKREKVLRVITKEEPPAKKTRHAIENTAAEAKGGDRIPVLGLAGVRNAINAQGLNTTLQADATDVKSDPVKRTGGMRLIRKIVVTYKTGGKDQGTIYVFLMTKPPPARGVDTHFGVRSATISDIVSGSGKGDDFAAKP